ncbi:hypothetical protein H0264_28180 [Nocardia huaxiensis]|uniref:Uncharacterized protein n=1 Tax=Nocardia huaxiensis TaxID=2755382 RepID=A0A7D6ZUQ4_9NOCA|nr:hypothetical protein [Nocardia huaxiensis]QLY29149.1 hypothetical protein H0264_28180 [Nocardia huaxiensis]
MTQDDTIGLEADFRTSGADLIVRYSVTNHRAEAVFAAERGNAGAYNLVPRSDKVIEISRRNYAVGGQCPVLVYEVPAPPTVARIEPGESLAREFAVPIPFQINHPYRLTVGDGHLSALPDRPYPVVFCIGVGPSEISGTQTNFCSPVHTV